MTNEEFQQAVDMGVVEIRETCFGTKVYRVGGREFFHSHIGYSERDELGKPGGKWVKREVFEAGVEQAMADNLQTWLDHQDERHQMGTEASAGWL